ncbi:5-(carboxyamino)imidazole ribonucleotide mutase [Melioribacteraceae bacterium 4301-Me]|uniref:5-(carboxyamino)imidazole ribonucleotide mutase n=1 Tax=Pyranulibacter aquaticus TaxID=3163344 RepID=UPI00359A9369
MSMKEKPLIGIIMGSDSDYNVMKQAAEVCKEFGVPYEIKIVSAHRTPNHVKDYAVNAAKKGVKVIIAGAGGAAHLPGLTASHTVLPVIGVPVKSKSLDGLDSLLSIVQMPSGVPVATVAIDNAKNAAILALQILAVSDKILYKKLIEYKKKMESESLEKNKKLKLG